MHKTLCTLALTGMLFLTGGAALASYLSGILIGAEVSGALRWAPSLSILVVASPMLGRLYQLAFSALGAREIRHIDAEHAVAKGLWRIWSFHQDGGMRHDA